MICKVLCLYVNIIGGIKRRVTHRDILSTHIRATVLMKDRVGKIIRVRKTSRA
jgi:DNA replication initiation complex subunit (GINS family)